MELPWSPRLDILLMDKILHDPKDPKLRELWYIPYNGFKSCITHYKEYTIIPIV